MTPPIRIGEQAEVELVEAARWYESHRAGLGMAFLDAVDTAVARIAEMPSIGSPLPGSADETLRRRAVLRLPYPVIKLELPDRLQVLAVAHDRRRPGCWVGRRRN